MKRSQLGNTCLNSKSDFDWRVYNKQQNIFVSLIRQEKSLSLVT